MSDAKLVTFDPSKYQLVPKKLDEVTAEAMRCARLRSKDEQEVWDITLAAAPAYDYAHDSIEQREKVSADKRVAFDVIDSMSRIPTVARLYYTGLGSRRYRRASTQPGPGEPLVFRSSVEYELHRLSARAALSWHWVEDSARLHFMLENGAWVQWTTRDGSIRQCQVYTQDEDENYLILSGEDRFFNTPREAIDAAISATRVKGA